MKISKRMLTDVCKIKTKETCRYLILGAKGFECAKLTDMKEIIDRKVEANTMNAVGDNCLGVDNKEEFLN